MLLTFPSFLEFLRFRNTNILMIISLRDAVCLFFISFGKWKQTPTKETRARINQERAHTKRLEQLENQDIKIRVYWTLGRYDVVAIVEAPTEKDAMNVLLRFQDLVTTETMVAVPHEDAIKLM